MSYCDELERFLGLEFEDADELKEVREGVDLFKQLERKAACRSTLLQCGARVRELVCTEWSISEYGPSQWRNAQHDLLGGPEV